MSSVKWSSAARRALLGATVLLATNTVAMADRTYLACSLPGEIVWHVVFDTDANTATLTEADNGSLQGPFPMKVTDEDVRWVDPENSHTAVYNRNSANLHLVNTHTGWNMNYSCVKEEKPIRPF
jgi:hypothetical protein